MTRKTVSSKPCPSNLRPGSHSAFKQRGTASTSPKAKRPKNGGSAKGRCRNGSRAGTSRVVSHSLPSKASSPHQLGSEKPDSPAAVELRLPFSSEQWADIQACAAYDKKSPDAWALEAVLSWIPETLEAIDLDRLPEKDRAAEEAKMANVAEVFRLNLAARVLGLSAEEVSAVSICAAWEGVGFTGFCRRAVVAFLEASFSDCEGFATGEEGYRHGGKSGRRRAAKHYAEAAPIMARLGWNGVTITRNEEAA